MNDPNGLVWFDGEYHLFFQHNPHGDLWGHMTWGHAVSKDLLHWDELQIAIPETSEHMMFSGSCVVDYETTSGFGIPENPAMVAIVTLHPQVQPNNQTQGLAYSTDRGRTWTLYQGNPVLDEDLQDFRDPKVWRDTANNRWVMVVAKPTQHQIAFYQSEDLKSWRHLSDFGPLAATGGVWECPDLFPLAVDGDPNNLKWVLIVSLNPGGICGGSGTQWFVGDWDGVRFTPEGNWPSLGRWIDYGPDCYAGVTFNDEPLGRRVLLPWMSNWDYAHLTPTSPWRGQMGVPRELTLKNVAGKVLLCSEPVGELSNVNEQHVMVLEAAWNQGADAGITLCAGDEQRITITKTANNTLTLERPGLHKPGKRDAYSVQLPQDPGGMTIVIDRCSVEIFTGDGVAAMSALDFPGNPIDGIVPIGSTRLERIA